MEKFQKVIGMIKITFLKNLILLMNLKIMLVFDYMQVKIEKVSFGNGYLVNSISNSFDYP